MRANVRDLIGTTVNIERLRRAQPGVLLAVFALVSIVPLASCSSDGTSTSSSTSHAVTSERALASAVFRGDGTPAGFAEVVDATARADVVLLGETHGHPVGLAWGAELFEALLQRSPSAALSMEFFERDDQTRLDDYLLGLTDEATFLKRATRSEGNYPAGHRRMVEAAKAGGRPVIAANTTWEIIRYLRGKTYDDLNALTAEQRRLFRVPLVDASERYKADFEGLMSRAKPESPEAQAAERSRLEGAFRAQYLWDWTMADSVVHGLDEGSAPVVHVVGRFHSDFRGGTWQAVSHMRPQARIVTISVVPRAGITLDEEDRDRADFVVYVGH